MTKGQMGGCRRGKRFKKESEEPSHKIKCEPRCVGRAGSSRRIPEPLLWLCLEAKPKINTAAALWLWLPAPPRRATSKTQEKEGDFSSVAESR